MTIRKTVWLFAMIVCISCSMMGCKTGTKFDNPFAKKPKMPSADTPAAIDGIQLSAPPEKYSKELTKNGDSSNGKLAQKGKYESESSANTAAPQMAMNSSYGDSIPPYNPGSISSGSTTTTQPVSATIPVASASAMPSSSYPTSSYPVAATPYPTTAPAQYPPVQNPPAQYPTPYPTATQTAQNTQQPQQTAPGFSSEPVYPPANPGYYATPTTGFAPGSIGGGY